MPKRAKLSDEVGSILRGSEPPASEPESQQDASKPAEESSSDAVDIVREAALEAIKMSFSSSKPASKRVKCTYRLDPHDVTLLEQERHRRKMSGKVTDYSALVREAIRCCYDSMFDREITK